MAMTGVLRPGHAVLRVLDLDESVKFYTDVMGLKETGRDKSGRVYFKCNDERDHCLVYGGDIDANLKLFEQVLGFSLVERVKLEDGTTDLATWLACSHKAHDIAMVRHSEDGKLHHVSFLLESWEQVLRAADIMSMHRVSIDIGPTRHGVTRGTTIYFFDPSGNRLETFCGGYQWYPDMKPTTWTWDEVGRGIFYHDRKLNDAFLSVLT